MQEGGGEGPEEDVTALQLRLAAKQRVWERMSCVKLLTQEEMMVSSYLEDNILSLAYLR